jgi:hypothetical protein
MLALIVLMTIKCESSFLYSHDSKDRSKKSKTSPILVEAPKAHPHYDVRGFSHRKISQSDQRGFAAASNALSGTRPVAVFDQALHEDPDVASQFPKSRYFSVVLTFRRTSLLRENSK